MASSFRALPYHEFRKRMESFGFHEDELMDGARTFCRATMGLGQPFFSVAYRGENGMVYPETIQRAVDVLGVPADLCPQMDKEAGVEPSQQSGSEEPDKSNGGPRT